MRITTRQHAGAFERYTRTTFAGCIGGEVSMPLGNGGPELGTFTVVDVVVVDEGRAADITYEVPEDSLYGRMLSGRIQVRSYGCQRGVTPASE